MPTVSFIHKDSKRQDCTFVAGESVLTLAKRSGIDLEGACEGAMACSTCHVIVASEWYGRLSAPTAEETDLLDFVSGVGRTSRLGCQILLGNELDGLIVRLP